MNRNLGQTSLHRTRRDVDPMQAYDALPTPLRQWLSQAALPWSPASARKIWKRAHAKGLNSNEALVMLCRAETKTLARDQRASPQTNHPTE